MSYQALIWLLHCAKSMLLTRDLEKSHTKANWKRACCKPREACQKHSFLQNGSGL